MEPNRLQIVELLRDGPLTVGEITERLGLQQPQASKHLKVLSEATIAQQCINAGLLDEIHVDLVPFILGDGVRLFEHLKVAPLALEEPQVSIGKGVIHPTYLIKK